MNDGDTSIAKGVETAIGVSVGSNYTQNLKVDKRKNNNSSFQAKQRVQNTPKVKRPFKEIHQNTLPSFQPPSQSRNNASKEGSSKFQEFIINWDDSTLVLDSEKVHFQIHSNNMFLKCTDIFRVLDMSGHIHNKGYTQIEKRLLSEHEKENCFLYENKRRKFVNLDAVLTLLDAKKGWWKGKHSSVKELLMNLRDKFKLRSNSCEETNSCSSELEEQTSSTGDVSLTTDGTNDSSSAFVQAKQADYYKRKLKFLQTKKYVNRRGGIIF